jgi:hypothetical protein
MPAHGRVGRASPSPRIKVAEVESPPPGSASWAILTDRLPFGSAEQGYKGRGHTPGEIMVAPPRDNRNSKEVMR